MSEETKLPEDEPLPEFLTIQAGGKEWKLGRIDFTVRLDAEEKVREQRRIEFRATIECLESVPEKNRAMAVTAAFEHLLRNITVGTAEASYWMATPSGELHQLWRSLQKATPAATIEDARSLLSGLTLEQFGEIQDFWGRAMGTHRTLSLTNAQYKLVRALLEMEP